MSLIFFEGFEHELHPDYWTLGSGFSIGLVGRNNGSARNWCLNAPQVANDEAFPPPKTTLTISPQTNKTLYVGFGVRNLSASANMPSEWLTFASPLVSFYDATNTEQFTLQFGYDDAQSSTVLFLTKNGSVINTFLMTAETGGTFTQNGWWTLNTSFNDSFWNFFEIEVKNINTSTVVSVRHNGQYLFPINVATSNVTSISKIAFYACPNFGAQYDDLYVVDNAGVKLNTWLTPDASVYSTAFPDTPVSGADEWTTIGSNVLNTNDYDDSYIKTSNFPRKNLYDLTDYNDMSTFDGKTIGGLIVWGRARKTSLDSAYKIVYAAAATPATTYDLSSKILVNAVNYTPSPLTLVTENPITTNAWTAAEIFTNGLFGVKSVDPA